MLDFFSKHVKVLVEWKKYKREYLELSKKIMSEMFIWHGAIERTIMFPYQTFSRLYFKMFLMDQITEEIFIHSF